MKKFISIILALSMLAVPVYGNEDYTKEELVEKVKEICNIGDYEEFEIESSKNRNNSTGYYMSWSDKAKGHIEVNVYGNGLIYYYNNYNNEKYTKNKIYSDTEAKAIAEEFLKKSLGKKYNDIKYNYCIYNQEGTYEFNYDIYFNNIQTTESSTISVNKYTNKIQNFYYPESITSAKYYDFDSTKTIDEAKNKINEGIKLGYTTKYDYKTKKTNVKLLYRFDDYSLRAKDLLPNNDNSYLLRTSGSQKMASENAAYDKGLTTVEIKEIENLKNVITIDKALTIIKNTLDIELSNDNLTTEYSKEYNSDNYSINIYNNSEENPFFVRIDSKGRIVTYYKDYIDDNGKNLSEEELQKKAEEIINKVNTDNYELTSVKPYNNYYYYDYDYGYNSDNSKSFTCNLKRNGYISFDENINVQLDTYGNLRSIEVNYKNDDIFTVNLPVNINYNEAINIAYNNIDFKPYYSLKTVFNGNNNEYSAIPVYSFEKLFTIDPENGQILNTEGEIFSEKPGLNEYTDINNQWYAGTVRDMAYMGYGYKSTEFSGDKPLTVGEFKELNYQTYLPYINNNEYSDDKILTRYDMAEIFMDIMECTRESKYNEIFIKPFDDVDFEHTGAVAILKARGIVGGANFRGNEYVTRAEALVMLYRYIISE